MASKGREAGSADIPEDYSLMALPVDWVLSIGLQCNGRDSYSIIRIWQLKDLCCRWSLMLSVILV